jgi:ABC-2 type transport system permease protein
VRRALAIAIKETFHILRDPFTLALALMLPVFIVAIFGFAIDLNVTDVRMTVYDRDRTQRSRGLVETFESSGYFTVRGKESAGHSTTDLDEERADMVLVIEPGFQRDSEVGASAQVLIDGTDNSTAGAIIGYLGGVQRAAVEKDRREPFRDPIEARTRYLFNPELNSPWFVVPGLAVVVTSILSVLLTSLTIAREWENGSMELLLSTPVMPIEIILGKLMPYTVLGMIALAFVYFISRVAFGIPFVGSHLLYILAGLLFLATSLAQGLLISIVMRRQQLAMQLGVITGLLPSTLLSGFVFPIESMPPFFQNLTSLLPAKWFMIINRNLFLKGSGFSELMVPYAALVLMAVILVAAATKRFKKDLEP